MELNEIKTSLAAMQSTGYPAASFQWFAKQLSDLADLEFDFAELKVDRVQLLTHFFAIGSWALCRRLEITKEESSTQPLFGTQPKDINELHEAKEFLDLCSQLADGRKFEVTEKEAKSGDVVTVHESMDPSYAISQAKSGFIRRKVLEGVVNMMLRYVISVLQDEDKVIELTDDMIEKIWG